MQGGRSTGLDCVVIHLAVASYMPKMSLKKLDLRLHLLKRASVRRLRDLVMALAMSLCPKLWSPLAGWEKVARFLNDLGDVAVESCASKAAFVRMVCQELNCALCSGNARMYDPI